MDSVLDLISSKVHVYWDDPLLLVLNAMAGTTKCSPYRLPVVDDKMKIKGVITGRRLLEILFGRRGSALRERFGLRGILVKNVGLFCDEVHSIFGEDSPVHAIVQYIVENKINNVFIADKTLTFKGIVDETAFLEKMQGKRFGIKVSEVMQSDVLTVQPETSLSDAAHAMLNYRVRRLPVVSGERVVGMITITDVLKHILVEERHIPAVLEDAELILEEKVEDIMIQDVVKIEPEADIGEAAERMLEQDVSSLVVEKERINGIVSRIDVVAGLGEKSGIDAVVELVKR